MRNRFNEPRRGRRPDRSGSAPISSSPYDFGPADDDQVDPVDLMAIRADDELLDALASGGRSLGGFGSGVEDVLDGDFRDDRQMLAMLAAWRDEVLDPPVPELVSVEQASEAIVAGQRTGYPRRRLMPVAAAAAAVVLGMSGVAIGAGSAEPGDPLWGVSKSLNSDRAQSKEAAQRVSVALASVRQALDEGRVKDAQATLAAVAPELDKVTDEQTKQELASKQANLVESAEDAKEGEKVHTDESGKRDDAKGKGGKDKGSTGHDPSKAGEAKQGEPGEKNPAGSGQPGSAGGSDPRRSTTTSPKPATPPTSPTGDKPAPGGAEPKPEPKQEPKPDSPKDDPKSDPKDDSTKPDSTKDDSKPGPDKKKDGEGDPATSTSTPTAAGPPPPPQFLAPVGP